MGQRLLFTSRASRTTDCLAAIWTIEMEQMRMSADLTRAVEARPSGSCSHSQGNQRSLPAAIVVSDSRALVQHLRSDRLSAELVDCIRSPSHRGTAVGRYHRAFVGFPDKPISTEMDEHA